VRYRQNGSAAQAGHPTVAPRYFRLGRAAGGGYSAQELPPPESFRSAAFLNVQAIAESRDGEVLFTVYCGSRAFSQGELGADFQPQLAAHIRGRRRATEIYPVYITDLDLSALGSDGESPLQTVDYLRHKQQLETLINGTLETVAG
jgi:adenylate cyclase class 1